MANLDDMIRNAVPGGNIAKPLLIALLGLLGSGALFKSGGAQSPAAPPPHPPAATTSHPPAGDGGGGLLGGLGGLLDRFQQKCHQFMDRERAKSAGTTWSTRIDSGTEYHKVTCSELRLVRGGAHQAVVADPSRSRRQTDAARPNSVPRRTQ